MTYRVSSNAAVGLINWDLAQNTRKLMTIQDQLASGKRLQRPSDNPGDTASALETRAQLRRTDQQTTNANDATGWLNQTDSTLMAVQTQLSVAKERAIQAVNGSLDDTARNGIANEIGSMRDAMVQLANTTNQGRSIFAGTVAAGTNAYSATGVYQGDDGAVRRNIADGVTVQINTNGPAIFGTPDGVTPVNGDVFQVLDTLSAAVKNNDTTQISASMAALDNAMKRVGVTQTKVGAMSQQIDTTINRNDQVALDATQRLSNIEDVDPAQAIIDFRVQENAYQAALAVTAKVIQPSLVDFLR
jgi:flagellar hook-associated protein 3 FlgL